MENGGIALLEEGPDFVFAKCDSTEINVIQ